jgi:hypothetical protein
MNIGNTHAYMRMLLADMSSHANVWWMVSNHPPSLSIPLTQQDECSCYAFER